MAEPVDYKKLYDIQDIILDAVFSEVSIFYLTGGTCINRFYSEKRYSDDLGFFTGDNNPFREYIRSIFDIFDERKIFIEIIADSRDFVRIKAEDILKVDFVNDRSFYYGKTFRHENGYIIDNALNMLSNKLSAIIGRDEPKDIFDIFLLSAITDFNWKTITEIAGRKALFEYDILEYRLKTFPLEMLDRLVLKEPDFLSVIKSNYNMMVNDILSGAGNNLYHKF